MCDSLRCIFVGILGARDFTENEIWLYVRDAFMCMSE